MDSLNVSCPVCRVPAGRACLALDLLPLPTPHVERTETTPLGDAAAFTVALDSAITAAYMPLVLR